MTYGVSFVSILEKKWPCYKVMAWPKTAVTPLLMHWSYRFLVLSHLKSFNCTRKSGLGPLARSWSKEPMVMMPRSSSWGQSLRMWDTRSQTSSGLQPCLSETSSKLRYLGGYNQLSNIRHTLVGNKIVDHSDVVGASPVGTAQTTSSFSTWFQWIG